jgi:hypothetical protein
MTQYYFHSYAKTAWVAGHLHNIIVNIATFVRDSKLQTSAVNKLITAAGRTDPTCSNRLAQ